VVARRPIGRSGISVLPFAFGGNVFGWTADRKTSFELLDRCVASGVELIDTADNYSQWVPGHAGGESESLIGEWLHARGGRHRVVIATKCGQGRWAGEFALSRENVLRACDASLRRLQTDYIDLYQAHRDLGNTPLEETLGAMAELVKAGKVRAIGASNFSALRLAEALTISRVQGLPRFESLQPHYNLIARSDFESALGPLCQREQLGVLPYYALASGFLTGKYRRSEDLAQRSPRAASMASQLTPRNLALLTLLENIAAQHQATVAQVALAWLLARGVTAPIASATSIAQLDELLPALRLQLDTLQMAQLDSATA
jgi:aryl-alcohol dehydrogenase-like predicted oxidoreductase